MLQLWSRRPFASELSFKLPRASTEGGRQPVQPLLTHHPYQMNNGMSYINTVLRIDLLLGHLPVTFLVHSVLLRISMVHFNTLTADLRSQITNIGLTAPIGSNGSPLDLVREVKIKIHGSESRGQGK